MIAYLSVLNLPIFLSASVMLTKLKGRNKCQEGYTITSVKKDMSFKVTLTL